MKKGLTSYLIAALLVAGCATAPPQTKTNATKAKATNIKEWVMSQNRTHRNAIIGAAIGTAFGALAGVASGGNRDEILRKAIAGGVVGAVAGFAFGKHQDKVYAGRDLAIQRANYDVAQGYVARVEAVGFNPPNPKAGDTATLYVRYLVLGPDPHESIHVRLFRGLKFGDNYVFGAGPNDFVVPQGGGLVESSVEVTLSKKASVGTYSVEALIEDEKNRFPQVIGTNPLYVVQSARQPHPAMVVAAR
ncbi:MAG TPA: hypothetical protein VGR95_18340 [Thermoanaerobaculia bacterium]|jgi:hypothetical protein|nr:hypothetical protein [Thermoanaerobaculia bacterium]